MDNNPNPPNESQPPAEGQPNFDARSYGGPQQPYGSNSGYPPPYGYGQQPPPGYGQYYNSYAPSSPTGPMLSTPTGIYPLAGFWLRVAAAVLDFVVLFVAGIIIGLTVVNGSSFWMNMLVSPLYIIGFITLKGATLGKLACGLRVIKAQGTAPTFGTAVGRYFAALLFQIIASGFFFGSFFVGIGSLFFMNSSYNYGYSRNYSYNATGLIVFFIGMAVTLAILGIDYIWVVWDPRKQALHDKMANTFVIKSRS